MWDAVWSLLQPQPWHPSVIRVCPYPNFSKLAPHTPHRNYSVRVNPYVHSQHIKVLKQKTHCIHPIWMWDAVCVTVFSLNHDNPTSFGFTHTPIFQKMAPSYLHMYYSVRVNPYAHPQHIKVLKHIVCILYGCGLQSEASCRINHDTTSSFGFTHTPIFQNSAPPPSGSI